MIGMEPQEFNRELIEKFRASGGVGEVGPVHFDRMVVLTTTGRHTGRPHVVPIGAARDDADNLLLFASGNASPRVPDWYRNIEASRHVTVEITGATWQADAEILEGAEREEALRRWIEMAPHVADHEEKAGRLIPMVRVRKP